MQHLGIPTTHYPGNTWITAARKKQLYSRVVNKSLCETVAVRGLEWGKLKATFVLLKDSLRHVRGEASSLQFIKLVHF